LHSAASFFSQIKDEDDTWANARLLIIDAVFFMNTKQVELLDEKLRALLHNWNSPFGGIHILYCGDFCQLEPVRGNPLTSPLTSHTKWVNSINCYVELTGLHR
jgi:PIF1-like helicase